MRTIPNEYIKHKYKRTLITREGGVVIYKLVPTHFDKTDYEGYEVMIVQKVKTPRVFPNGNVLSTGSEYLPSDEQWGTYGWTFTNLQDAETKFRQLVNKLQKGL